ncbi:nucleoside permease [Terriglobus saanensis]|uniref:Nucleoside:H+ symporter n=1 Tax=Terriglobus saanensis (strain ATCC BAA-1853 / DSM 23119 / SP1PR4) TaxID=401053 RepID=E8V340_TERSS|nr:nucleoside permease [Terriglobus saanensis]ADV81315.1 nucleoside:H+ symporter [Terriglobus saanensis SP1PR4]
MTNPMKARLSAMMFLEYFVWGSWYVTLATWLTSSLHFTGQQIGLAAGTTAVGAMIAPFFMGLVADKVFATERLLSCLHLLGAVLLFVGSQQVSFAHLYVVVLLYCLCFMPTLALTNSLAFRQMSDPTTEFGAIRVLGTAGWIVAGLLVGSLGLESTARPMQLAAAASVVMAVYCLTLPHTPPLARGTGFSVESVFPREAIGLLKERSMAVFALTSFFICIPLQFYYAFTNLFLNEAGVQNAAGKMTGGQVSELLCMVLLPWFFRRLGVKYMLAAGISAWALRYVFFALGGVDRMPLLWLGIILHGICYDFFFVTGQIYIDRKASLALRAAAQGLITFITYGAGMFVGSWLSGAVVEHYTIVVAGGAVMHDWRSIWLLSAGASAAVLVIFLVAFTDKSVKHATLAGDDALAPATLT